MFRTGSTTRMCHNRQCRLLHLSRLHSRMPTARVNDTGCSRSTDRLETDGGQVRHSRWITGGRSDTLQDLTVVQALSPLGML